MRRATGAGGSDVLADVAGQSRAAPSVEALGGGGGDGTGTGRTGAAGELPPGFAERGTRRQPERQAARQARPLPAVRSCVTRTLAAYPSRATAAPHLSPWRISCLFRPSKDTQAVFRASGDSMIWGSQARQVGLVCAAAPQAPAWQVAPAGGLAGEHSAHHMPGPAPGHQAPSCVSLTSALGNRGRTAVCAGPELYADTDPPNRAHS